MSDLKTTRTDKDVFAFINSIENEKKRSDSLALVQLMQEVMNEPPVMWGDAIIGFGSYRYEYKSGRDGEWFLVGFAPRKTNLTLYIKDGFAQFGEDLAALGKCKPGTGCLYVNKLADIDTDKLKALIRKSTGDR